MQRVFTRVCLGLLNAFLIAGTVLFDCPRRAQQEAASPTTPESLQQKWEASIRPILQANCLPCHNSLKLSARLSLETIPELMAGSMHGDVIDLSRTDDSLLLKVLQPTSESHMPPEGQLSAEQIRLIESFVGELGSITIPKAWQKKDKNENDSDSLPPTEARTRLPDGIDPTLAINLAVQQSCVQAGVVPTTRTGDDRFVKRLYLDLVGRIPTLAERNEFLEQTNSDKRSILIDRLLASNENAIHFAEVLDAMLIGRTDVNQQRKAASAGWDSYLEEAIRQDRPWNDVVREILIARPKSQAEAGSIWYLYSRKNKHQEMAEAVARDFFGMKIDCAQCHDHPLAPEIEQRFYWGLTAFFNRSTNVDTPNGPRLGESAIGGFSEFANLRGSSSPNELVFIRAKSVSESRPAKDIKEEDRDDLYLPATNGEPRIPRFSRRERFVEDVLTDHPMVATAMVNRIWAWMMGRGIVHPIDKMDSFHPPSHPELLEWLANDFRSHHYSLKRLLRAIACSDAYQSSLSSDPTLDPKWFAAVSTKPLTAEMLLRSLLTALDVKETDKWLTPEKRVAFAKLFPDVLAEESLATISQSLMLSNGEWIHELLTADESRTIEMAQQTAEPSEIVRQLYAHILLREPDQEESSVCQNYLNTDLATRRKRVQGLAWALLTSSEFRFNQ
jgi:hypothetical protein